MAEHTPQLEDGYVRFATEWLEELIRAPYSGAIKDFVLIIARETWGWNKTWREISTQRIAQLLVVSDSRVRQLRTDACRYNLVECEPVGSSKQMRYRVQKDWRDWIEPRVTGKWAERSKREDVLTDKREDVLTDKREDVLTDKREDVLTDKREDVLTPAYIGITDSLKDNLKRERGEGTEADPDYQQMLLTNDPLLSAVKNYFCSGNPPVLSIPQAQDYTLACKKLLAVPNADLREADLLEALAAGNGPLPGKECGKQFGPEAWIERLRREKKSGGTDARADPDKQDLHERMMTLYARGEVDAADKLREQLAAIA